MIQRLSGLLCDATSLWEKVFDMMKERQCWCRIQEEQDGVMEEEQEVGDGMFLWHELASVYRTVGCGRLSGVSVFTCISGTCFPEI
jgi:hypothetical protein